MRRIYAIITQKGGVGKTTTVNALASSFSKQGFKVLAVDMDPQGNLSFSTGASDDMPTVFDALVGNARVKKCIQKRPMTDVIPSNILLTGAELEFTGKNREFVLKNVLQVVKNDYDYIFIDSPPGLGFLTVNALAASDYVILPMLPDIFSLQGLVQVYETIEFVKRACNPDLEVAGILINKYRRFSKLHRESVGTAKMVAENYDIPIFNTYIRSSPALSEAQSLQCSIFEYAPNAAGVKDYYNLSLEILNSN
ncbi:MAG: AAA family ATPase [Clostridium sp.]|nr:AAA family ATPase [Clostridium sp.]MCM1547800.1 AAA family ATPase [Ruminococcus sp.]